MLLAVIEHEGTIRVTSLPEEFGERMARPQVLPPLDERELHELQWYLEDYLRRPYAVYADRARDISEKHRHWGEKLFRSVFATDAAKQVLDRALADSDSEIVLVSNSGQFLKYPWELMAHPETGEYLALKLSGIRRCITMPAVPSPSANPDPLQVLVVVARPAATDVPYGMVARPALCRLLTNPRIRVDLLRPPTFEQLCQQLADASAAGCRYHVLHLDMHGESSERDGTGVLLFEPDLRSVLPAVFPDSPKISAKELASVIAGHVNLVVMNACRSAYLTDDGTLEMSVATALIASGVPAVVAAGYRLQSRAAALFMSTFYDRVSAGNTIGSAMVRGRRALHDAPLRDTSFGERVLSDWCVPVLYGSPSVQLARGAQAEPCSVDFELLAHLQGRDAEVFFLERALNHCLSSNPDSLSHRKAVLLHGARGVGKTFLANAFAHWCAVTSTSRSPCVALVPIRSAYAEENLDEYLISNIGRALLGDSFGQFRALRDKCADVHSCVEQRLTLIVLDGLEELRDQSGLLNCVHELVKRGALVLMTSVSEEKWLGNQWVERCPVPGLPKETALVLGKEIMSRAGVPEAVRESPEVAELIDELSNNPQAIQWVVPELQRVSSSALREALRSFGRSNQFPQLGGFCADVRRVLATLTPEERQGLPLLASFQPNVSAALLEHASESLAASGEGTLRADEWLKLLERLSENGLATPALPMSEVAQSARTYALHPLLAVSLEEPQYPSGLQRACLQGAARFVLWLATEKTKHPEDAQHIMGFHIAVLRRLVDVAVAPGHWSEATQLANALFEHWITERTDQSFGLWSEKLLRDLHARFGTSLLASQAGELAITLKIAQAQHALLASDYEAARTLLIELGNAIHVVAPPVKDRLSATFSHLTGLYQQRSGYYNNALICYERALVQCRLHRDIRGEAAALHQIALLHESEDALGQAVEELQRECELRKKLHDVYGLNACYLELSRIEAARGHPEAAAKYNDERIKLGAWWQGGVASTRWWLLQNTRMAQDDDRPHHQLVERFEGLVQVAMQRGDYELVGHLYDQLGAQAVDVKDFALALSWFSKARFHKQRHGTVADQAISFKWLAMVSSLDDKLPQSLDYAKRGLQIAPTRHRVVAELTQIRQEIELLLSLRGKRNSNVDLERV